MLNKNYYSHCPLKKRPIKKGENIIFYEFLGYFEVIYEYGQILLWQKLNEPKFNTK